MTPEERDKHLEMLKDAETEEGRTGLVDAFLKAEKDAEGGKE
jgi:hypothetical protein